MAKLMRSVLLLAKIETTVGTDSVPVAATNAILAQVTNPQPVVAEFVDRNIVRPYFGNAGKLQVASRSEMEIEVEFASSGTLGTAPAYGPLLLACGFSENISMGVNVTYMPASSSLKTVTIYYFLDGIKHVMTGCRGDVSIDLNAKSIPVYRFKFTGFYNAPTDTANPSGAVYTSFKDPLAVNKLNTPTLSIHGVTGAASQFSLAMNNQIVYRNMIAVESIDMTDRKPSGNATIEMTTVASKAWHEVVRLGTLSTMQLVHGVGAGNIIQIDAPKVQITDPSYQDSDGVAMLSMGLVLQPNAGNDEISIVIK